MRTRMISVLGAAVLAASACGVAAAGDAHAPPVLTPAMAQRIAAACPGSAAYARALVRGISDAEAAAAAPLLSRCASQVRFAEYRWKNDAAQLGLAAVELSRGLLRGDAAMLAQAAAATSDLRAHSAASDAQIRTWTVIPDMFNAARNELVVEERAPCYVSGIENAAYINVAARTGAAWVREARDASTVSAATPPGACASGSPGFTDSIALNRRYDSNTSPERPDGSLRNFDPVIRLPGSLPP